MCKASNKVVVVIIVALVNGNFALLKMNYQIIVTIVFLFISY